MVRQTIGRFYYSGRGPEGMYMYYMISEKTNPFVGTYFAVHFPTKDYSAKIQRIELDPDKPSWTTAKYSTLDYTEEELKEIKAMLEEGE